LLLGFAALVVVLTQYYAPPSGASGTQPVLWNASNVRPLGKKRRIVDGELQLVLRRNGSNSIKLDTGGIDAEDYAFLHLAVENPPADLTTTVYINWKGPKHAGNPQELRNRSPTSLWLATHELEGWTGTIDSVTLLFNGPPGETVRIRDFALYPGTPLRQLRAIYSDLTSNAPWRRADMNSNTGVAKESSFYPVPLAVSLLLLSALAYGALLLLFRKRLKFNWEVVGLIFLACWVALDLVWQNRLLYQAENSQRLFAGKDTPGKLAVGPDKKLYRFISQAKKHIEPADARVFVATTDIYRGMRGAYYLLPFNAFWRLEPPEIPHDYYLRKGDYFVLIHPSQTRLYTGRGEGRLRGPENRPHRAELLYSDDTGTLVRLK
jgi:hypothetical protein